MTTSNNFTDYAATVEDEGEMLEAIVHLQSVFRGHATRTKLKKASARSKGTGKGTDQPLRLLSEGTGIGDFSADEELSPNTIPRGVASSSSGADEQPINKQKKKRERPPEERQKTENEGNSAKKQRSGPLKRTVVKSTSHAGSEKASKEGLPKRGLGRPRGSLNKKTIMLRAAAMAAAEQNRKEQTQSSS